MKNILFTLALLITFTVYSQKEYGKYTTSDGVLINSSAVVIDGDSQGGVYLNLSDDGKTSINFKSEKERIEFINFINRTYIKFKEWKTKAEENNVTDTRKEIESGMFGNNISFYYGSWKFSFGKNKVSTYMSINEKGKVIYYLYIPSVEASDNEFIESDSMVLIMYDQDIESLNNILSSEVIDKFVKSETSKDDLFN